MKIRTRIFVVFVLVTAAGVFGLVHWMQNELRPNYLQAQEDPLVDLANLLAVMIVEQGLLDPKGQAAPDTALLTRAFDRLAVRRLAARIYALEKTEVDIRVYVTDAGGRVLFDSTGRDTGADYSQWRDVRLTLRGEYGARTTDGDPLFPDGSTMYVAAPITSGDVIVGAVSVGKPTRSAERFLDQSVDELALAGLFAAATAILVAAIIYLWVSRPLARLHTYAAATGAGQRTALPALGNNEIGQVGAAIESMRKALDGKAYVEHYVQALTHELKSPLAAIQGAAELLDEDMSEADRRRFLANIRDQVRRLGDIVDRLLDLAAIESRGALERVEPVDLNALVAGVVEDLRPVALAGEVAIELHDNPGLSTRGDAFLLRQAVTNLLKNAIEFSPAESSVQVDLQSAPGGSRLRITDRGPGIPAYAREKVFERFFSLPRPGGRKGTGLGLTFVREIVALHAGSVTLETAPTGGSVATLVLPG